ncbi:type I restriction-modification system subunit M [Massilimicrobiota sp. An142]|uniref:type I restriction-modification system subunit M n=1 Tax=Massilimicrobiota sp. An142 TaxID=1965564 RepID=UPI000B3AD104|nr:type I restriction-modification system subunit M [Massilimicrobiota sp. An142]OUQ14207.1 type I restriction-modification system subunit M [Massilimicrobiota sp. An142]
MADKNTYQAQANELSQKLWAIANELRGQMDASEFKNYILGVIFYRYLSERTELYMAEILENDGITYEEAFADDDYREAVEEWSLSKLGYIIRPENLFRNLIRKVTKFRDDADKFSVEDFEKAISELVGSTMGYESNKAFDGLFDDMRLQDSRLGETVADRTDMIGRVMVRVSDIDFDLQDSQFDVLGTAYMILIGLFASDAGKKGGEFFTPAGPSKLCATLAALGLDEAKTVGDCTCGSASMLLEVQKHLTTGKVGHFYGQEKNATTYNLSRMNMIMHGVDWQNFDIYKGDTLTDDKFGDTKMTVQVCNPPYSLKWSSDKKFEDDPRYSGVGKLAPKSAADLAFVEHMIYHMDDEDGRVAVLLPHGVLFRGGAEEAIRKYIIKDLNRLDAVIGLPANLFHGTGIPVCVLVLKSKRNGNSGNILFIDASKEFKPGKNQNTLEQEHIDKIVDAYEKRQDIDKFAHVADMSEIVENDYNLNIPRYVDTFEEEEPVDLSAVRADIQKLDAETKAAIDKAERFLKELGL